MTDSSSEPSTPTHLRHNPTDPDALNAALARWSSAVPRLEVSRVDVGDDGPAVLIDVLDAVAPDGPVVVVRDATLITRNGEDVRALITRLVRDAGRDVTEVTLTGDHGGDPHTTMERVTDVADVVGDDGVILTVGAGTVTDIGKHAAHVLDDASGGRRRTPLVFFPTANSVCAYGAAMAPVTADGVKRTRPSRLPDAVVVDVPTLRDAPLDMTLAGIGDLCAMFVSYGDWYLHCRFGGGQWYDAAWELATDVREQLFASAGAMGRREPAATVVLAKLLLLAGFSVSTAGVSAPLSGYEHVTGHLLDLQAEYGDRDVGRHGLQTGTATLPCAVAFAALLDRFDPAAIDIDACYPDTDQRRALVHATFDEVDPSGTVSERCWDAYLGKLEAWRDHRDAFVDFLADWPDERELLEGLVTPPDDVVGALRDAGVPTRWRDLSTPIPESEARWAFDNARLFRDRFSSVDLLDLAGMWGEPAVDDLWARAVALAGDGGQPS